MTSNPKIPLTTISPKELRSFRQSITLAGQEHSPSDYCDATLMKLGEHIAFDRAIWGMATHEGDRDMFMGFRLDAAAVDADYRHVATKDPLIPQLMSHPNVAVRMDIEQLDPTSSQALIDWLNRWGLQRVLSMGISTDVTEVKQVIGIYRGVEKVSFNQAEQEHFSQLVPMIVEGLQRSRENELKEQLFAAWSSSHFVATATKTGAIFDMEPRFLAGLQTAWPAWQGPTLPPEVVQLLQEKDLLAQLKKGPVLLQTLPSSANHLLVMTELGELGDLTPRQFQVARLYARGASTIQIAQQLDLKIATVQNHRKHIYSVLGIGSNNELTHQFRRLDGPNGAAHETLRALIWVQMGLSTSQTSS